MEDYGDLRLENQSIKRYFVIVFKQNMGFTQNSEMRWMQGTDIDDVYLILRNGCKEASAVFLASF